MYTLVVVFTDLPHLEVSGLTKEEASEALKEIRPKLNMTERVMIKDKAVFHTSTARFAYVIPDRG